MACAGTVAIIGGGPAGSMAAHTLLGGGHSAPERVLIFEEKLGWEKPCGGGLTQKALDRYPFLADRPAPVHFASELEIAASEASVRLTLRRPMAFYSRADLNRLLLDRACAAGAQLIAEHVKGFERKSNSFAVYHNSSEIRADYLILAGGARTRLRQLLAGDFSPRDQMLTLGYFVPESDSLIRLELYRDFEGYAWSFPRRDHRSVGVCGKVQSGGMAALRSKLSAFIARIGANVEDAPVYSHLLPSLTSESWSNLKLAGKGWAIVGDAAGLSDPLTGEGIYYALRSGELLAEALLAGEPEAYSARLWNDFGSHLMFGARLCRAFYKHEFLGRPVTTQLAALAARSEAFRALFQDLVEGEQGYPGLVSRVIKTFGRAFVESAEVALREAKSRLAQSQDRAPRFTDSA